MNKPDARDYRLDLLKAIAIGLVLCWHLQPFYVKTIPEPNTWFSSILGYIPFLIGLFYYQLTLIGVPLFIIVSLYLFYGKIGVDNYFRKRMVRITQIFVFWAVIQCGIYLLLKFLANAGKISGMSFAKLNFGRSLMMGGPELPFVGGSVFYFLFNLIFLYILAYGYYRLNSKIKKPLGLLVIALAAAYFQFAIFSRSYLPFWRIENFLIYIPIAYLLRFSDRFSKFKKFYLLGFVIFAAEEFMVGRTTNFLGGVIYDRISIVLGVITLASFVLESSKPDANEKTTAIIRYLSIYSLGIYAMHKYWQLLLLLFPGLYSQIFSSPYLRLFNLDLDILRLAIAAAAVIFTLLSVWLLGKTPLKRFVS